MSLELLEKFLIELAPPKAHNPIHKIFKEMVADPVLCMGQGFEILYPSINEEGSPESAAAVNGIILGIVLHYGAQRSTRMQAILEEYVEHHKKGKKENVISFASARVGKK